MSSGTPRWSGLACWDAAEHPGGVRLYLRRQGGLLNPLLERLLDYDGWANWETLQSLRQGIAPARSLRWMGHIIGAEYLWLARMQGRPSELPVWPDLTLEQCEARLRSSPEHLEKCSGSGATLRQPYAYTNSKGEPWTSTVEEILTHVVIHSAYHRGQIASDVRAAGHTPAYTDYIHAVRQGLLGLTLPSAGPLLIVVRLGIALIGCLVWSGGLALVRPAARGHADRAGHGAGLHPAGLDVPGLGGVEPHHVSHQSTVLGAIQR